MLLRPHFCVAVLLFLHVRSYYPAVQTCAYAETYAGDYQAMAGAAGNIADQAAHTSLVTYVQHVQQSISTALKGELQNYLNCNSLWHLPLACKT
jgi:hypothetical protein